MEALEALGINGPFLISQLVNFLILFIMLRVLLWKPLLQKLDERRTMLEKEKDDAAALEEARANIGDEKSRSQAEAREEAKEIIAQAREQAGEITHQTTQEANQEAKKILEAGRQAAEEERNRILGEARGQITTLAIAVAQQIMAEKLDEKRQHALVDSFFSGIREGRVAILPEELGPADAPVVVTSAIPLTKKEQRTISRDLVELLGEGIEVSFQVDPDILGGLIVHVGNRVVDGSITGQLKKLQESLV